MFIAGPDWWKSISSSTWFSSLFLRHTRLTNPQQSMHPMGVSFSPSCLVVSSSSALLGAVFLLSSTSHPPLGFPQGSSPLSQSDLTACPGTPCLRSARQHTGLSDGPPGRGPSNRLWRRTPSGCPARGAAEHRYNQSIIQTSGQLWLSQDIITSSWNYQRSSVSLSVNLCLCTSS